MESAGAQTERGRRQGPGKVGKPSPQHRARHLSRSWVGPGPPGMGLSHALPFPQPPSASVPSAELFFICISLLTYPGRLNYLNLN